MYKNMYQI